MARSKTIVRRLPWLALIIVLNLLAACAVNPVTGQQELVLMSEQQELAMGAHYYPETTQMNNGLVPHDQGLQEYVSQVGHKLARVSHRPGIPWEFNVVNSDQVNAFALPGGKISLTRGLIAKMDSEDEMASVLAHEIGHVTARHSVAQYTRGAFISMAVAGAGLALSNSDYQEAGAMAAGVAGGLLMLSYSRDQERQADELGYDYMVRAGYNPVGQIKTFEMFQELNKSEPGFIAAMLSSHPLTTERVEAARQRVAAAPSSARNRPLQTASFSKAVARQKKREPAYAAEAKGDALMKKKHYAAAANNYRQAAKLYAGDGVFLAKLAIAEYKQKNMQQAKSHAARGAQISPGVYFPNFVAGAIHYQMKDYGQARKYLSQADRLLPSQPRNKLMLAASYERVGQRRAAARAYRQVINLSPRSEEARSAAYRLNQMGYRY
jgi:predicted Zn-dependent protease